MMASVQWQQDATHADNVMTRGFTVVRDGQAIPGVRLHAYPGVHVDNGPEAFDVQAAFLKRYFYA